MRSRLCVLTVLVLASSIAAHAQSKPVLLVNQFTLAPGVKCPYDLKILQLQTVLELRTKESKRFEVVPDPPNTGTPAYTLQGEILEWQPGDMATRLLVGMGAGREMAKIHYWITDAEGKKRLEYTDIIRTSLNDNVYEKSTGHLARPFAVKIEKRLSGNKSL